MLGSLIGMMDHTGWFALCDCHVHRVDDQLGLLTVTHGPADDLAAEGIQYDG